MLPNNAWRTRLNRFPRPPSHSTSLEYEYQSRSSSYRFAAPPSRYQADSFSGLPAEDRCLGDNNRRPRFPIVASLYSFFCTTAHAAFRLFLRFLWTFVKMVGGVLLQPIRVTAFFFQLCLCWLWTFVQMVGGVLFQAIRAIAFFCFTPFRLILCWLRTPLFMSPIIIALMLLLFLAIFDLAPRGAVKLLQAAEAPAISIESVERWKHMEAALSRISLDFERTRSKGESQARLNVERLQRLEGALSGLSLHYERTRSEITAEARLNAELAGKIGVLEAQVTHAAANSKPNSLGQDLEALQLFLKAFQPRLDVARPDFALHSSGASVIPSLTSPTFTLRQSTLHHRIFSYFTGNVVLAGRPPVTALHYDIHDGHCWPFAGSQGQLGIVLAAPIYIEDITIDHVASAVAVSRRKSAPRDMEVWALVEGQDNVAKLEAWRAEMTQRREHELARPKTLPKFPEYIRIASFQYDIHSSNNIQTFPIDAEIRSLSIDFGVVVLMVKGNWGMDEYTCLYRIRVHGQTMDASAIF